MRLPRFIAPHRAQITCRRLKPLLARRARIPSTVQSSLTKFGIPITAPVIADSDLCGDPAHVTPDGTPPPTTPITSATELLAIDPDRGEWMLDARQVSLWPRLRANAPMIAICSCLVCAAVANVTTMTVVVNGVVASSERAGLIHIAATDPGIASGAHILMHAAPLHDHNHG